ncbi:MAG: transcription initiation factor IIB 2, partial [Candidatus Heimdallarchaeota archaeon]|nr:transcription initiation factor IIB 2 [Candidatus Heimdallarchaeota archaeon]
MTTHTCFNCSSEEIITDKVKGEYICSNCGLVISRIIDSSPEWRAFTGAEKASRSRVGPPISALKADYGISSQICGGSRDIFGNKLNPTVVSKMRRLRWLNRRDSRSHIRNLRIALRELR